MKRFTYEIEIYPAGQFSDIVFYCTDQGECRDGPLSSSQIEKLRSRFNERGTEGWELAHVSIGGSGLFTVWKKESISEE